MKNGWFVAWPIWRQLASERGSGERPTRDSPRSTSRLAIFGFVIKGDRLRRRICLTVALSAQVHHQDRLVIVRMMPLQTLILTAPLARRRPTKQTQDLGHVGGAASRADPG